MTEHGTTASLVSINLRSVSEWQDGRVSRFQDCLAAEEPLEIRVNGLPLSVTMRTPGDDPELAAGFLLTEGIIEKRDQIVSITQEATGDEGKSPNVIAIELSQTEINHERMKRNFFASASCGVCGKASIGAIRVPGIRPPDQSVRVDPELLCTLPERLRMAQTVFGKTGGLHAAAIFDHRGNLAAIREDVGWHNAVDKIAGWALLEGRTISGQILMVSGRGGFEIVQKALVTGVSIVCSVSAPSSLAVQLSREYGMTLVGFLRGRRFVVYAGEERLNL